MNFCLTLKYRFQILLFSAVVEPFIDELYRKSKCDAENECLSKFPLRKHSFLFKTIHFDFIFLLQITEILKSHWTNTTETKCSISYIFSYFSKHKWNIYVAKIYYLAPYCRFGESTGFSILFTEITCKFRQKDWPQCGWLKYIHIHTHIKYLHHLH